MNLLKKIFEKYLIYFYPIKFAKKIGVKIGQNCRLLGISKSTFGSEPYLISIGNHVTVTGGVRFVTHDGGVWVFREELPDIDVFGKITIGNNVFIGLNVTVLPNTTIGDNVVIGACSLVKGTLASNKVYAGIPAKPIMSIEDYKNNVLSKADYIRSKSYDFKRNYILEKFKDE